MYSESVFVHRNRRGYLNFGSHCELIITCLPSQVPSQTQEPTNYTLSPHHLPTSSPQSHKPKNPNLKKMCTEWGWEYKCGHKKPESEAVTMKQNDDCRDQLTAFSRACRFYRMEYTMFREECPGCEREREERRKREEETMVNR